MNTRHLTIPAALALAVLLSACGSQSTPTPTETVTETPEPEVVTETVTETVEVETTPDSCIEYIDLSEIAFTYAAEAMGAVQDMDVAAMSAANDGLNGISDQMLAAKEECRAAGV